MNEAFTLTTPALLFSAISLILLAYTNRFVAYNAVIRNLYKQYRENPTTVLKGQIENLRRRLYLNSVPCRFLVCQVYFFAW